MNKEYYIGIDLGGTNVRAGLVNEQELSQLKSRRINAGGSVSEVLEELFAIADPFINDSVKGIGIGVPGLVNTEEGIVYDVVNIPSWKEVPLRKQIEERYGIPVLVNNDANCFALGEFYFGKGKGHHSMIGLAIGTGLGSGIILHDKLYSGSNCGAGEFGMIQYKDHYYEYYASGQFFQNVHGRDGEQVFQEAKQGNPEAIKMYEEMGGHLGNAIKTILYSLDVDLIVLGGSVRKALPYFSKAMWNSIGGFAFKKSIAKLKIEVSELEHCGLLGAAALFYDQAGRQPATGNQ
jgi:glucokinase